jgi:hypothetical protein
VVVVEEQGQVLVLHCRAEALLIVAMVVVVEVVVEVIGVVVEVQAPTLVLPVVVGLDT